MKRFISLIAMLLALLVPCTGQTKSSLDLNQNYKMGLGPSGTPRPALSPLKFSPIPGADAASTPQPSPDEAPTPEPKLEYENLIINHAGSFAIAIIATMANFGFGIWVIVIFFSIKEERDDKEMGIAIKAAIFMVAVEVVSALLRTNPSGAVSLVTGIMGDAVVFIKLLFSVYAGIHLWRRLGNDYWGLDFWKMHRARMFGISTLAVAVAVLYSSALLYWLHPTAGWAVKILTSTTGEGIGYGNSFALLLFVANFAFTEEFVYRGCFQPLIASLWPGAQGNSWPAIFIVAFLWTIGHAGSLSPDWIKFLQVFPLGVFLGWWYGRAGYIGALTVHLGFNIIMAFIAGHLIAS